MTLEVDLFWSFRSPYSYLGTPRYAALEAEWDLMVNVRPVYPIAIRTPEFFQKIDLMWPAYLMKDVYRVADFLGLPFDWPRPDPVVMDMKTRSISTDQPYIHRLTRLGIAAVERGAGMPFLREISALIWGSGTADWHLGSHLADATARAGLDLAEMDAAIAADPDGYEAKIRTNEDALTAAGHWGVPTLAFRGEPFFGQDRIDMCLWRMQQAGLEPRGS